MADYVVVCEVPILVKDAACPEFAAEAGKFMLETREGLIGVKPVSVFEVDDGESEEIERAHYAKGQENKTVH